MSSKVFCIGQDILKKEYEAVLAKKGLSVVSFKALKDVHMRNEEQPLLLLVDKQLMSDPSFAHFSKTFKALPKIVFTDTHSLTGLSAWVKLPFTYPVSSPSAKELGYTVDRILREKKLTVENENLNRSLESIRKEFAFFEEVNRTLNSSLELTDILNTIMRKARSLIRAETWSVLLVEEESGELYFEKTGGSKKEKEKMNKARLKLGEGIAGWVAQEGIPVIVPDVSVDPRFCARIDESINFKTKSLMCVPIKSKGRVLGVFEIVNKTTGDPFTKDDLNLLMRLVDQAALAIERASLYQKMTELSITDDLTKLFNTRYLNRTLEIEITRSNRHKSSLALIFMDIDHFKMINDNYGHLVGSKLLAEMGQLLIRCLRSMDIVARYGGDEFVIVLPQTTPKHAVQIAERIRRSVEQNVFMKKEGYSLRMTASFGVASYPESAKSKEDLLRLADEAMYRVKYQTRNGVYAIV